MANRVLRRRVSTLSLLAGAATAGLIAGAGGAYANPDARAGHPGRDTTGAHHIDPLGYNHTDPNVLRQREHQDARRDYRDERYGQGQAATPGVGGSGGDRSWTAVPREDGSGYTVCRPRAGWC
ncbi:hypothetical protein ACWEKT_34125 [Nocardia takedensis]|uniref:hypothetical protein n=1 Tax=Nocardia takedensis TaxID=259390 RepID=UPI0002D33BB8|nr:hypothetical protein [Nocardia takedensis]